MRRSDIGFALLAAVLLSTLGWWWASRYADEKEALGDRLDVALADWRTHRIQESLAQVYGRSVSYTSNENIKDVSPGVKVDLVNERVIHIDTVAAMGSAEFPVVEMKRLMKILHGGFAMGASGSEVDSVLTAIAKPLGVTLQLVETDSTMIQLPDTVGRFFRAIEKEVKTITKTSTSDEKAEYPSASPDFVFVEGSRGEVIGRILPEVLMGVLLFVGLLAFYGLLRRDLLRREAALAEKDRFIANVAHELKTPIAVVGVALESLERFGADADPERRSRYLKTSREELGRLELLAERALGTLLLEAETSPNLAKERVNLNELVASSWKSLSLKHDLSEASSTAFPVTLGNKTSDDATVYGDPLLLRHLLDNLLDNAVKYGGDVNEIEVSISPSSSMISIVVSDNGSGIPLSERKKVFDKFYRIENVDEGHLVKGHGLGLSYVRQIVLRHGGDITIEGGPEGKGTVVTVKLPRQ